MIIYEIINQHSFDCLNNIKDNNEIYDKSIKELTIFKDKCFEKLNNYNEYNRSEMKKFISDLYNLEKYNFHIFYYSLIQIMKVIFLLRLCFYNKLLIAVQILKDDDRLHLTSNF